jgi:hypothetical protein
MKDILAAGKKPATVLTSADIAVSPASITLERIGAPEELDRRQEIYEFSTAGDLERFVQISLQAIRQEVLR